ncbi:MAG: cyclase family protein [Scytolyngbya sp. HA4215-MV1]|jgi:kynurenine formamidase|nr:cyclase family protein [Scytolyngbya sp. HA4215-MV1]
MKTIDNPEDERILQQKISYRQIVDLSHPIHANIPRWGGDPDIVLEPVAQIDREGYFLRRFAMGEHSATHMNAPNSFFRDAPGIDAYPAASLVVSACVVNCCEASRHNLDYELTLADWHIWEQQCGRLSAGSLVLLYTGWQAKWHDPAAFLNLDDRGIAHFPGFGVEVTQFLLEQRAIAGVGTDTHGVDPGIDTHFSTNRLVLAQQGIVLECLNNLDRLPAIGTTLAIGRLPLQGGSGSPVSVLAFVP